MIRYWLLFCLAAFYCTDASAGQANCPDSAALGQAALSALTGQGFDQVNDHGELGGAPIQEPPSIDLAVIAFAPGCAPIGINLLYSRDFPEGRLADIDPDGWQVTGINWKSDRRDPDQNNASQFWLPGADWDLLAPESLLPDGSGDRFVLPYPTSMLKLMPAVRVMSLVDAGEISLDDALVYAGINRTLAQWLDEMITVSSNTATFALTWLLHQLGDIQAEEPPDQQALPCAQRTERTELVNGVNALLAGLGLETLQFNNTRPCDGSFFNNAGSGVGFHHMSAWDTARLLWLIDPRAPAPSWLVDGEPVDVDFLSQPAREHLLAVLAEQGLHEVLSTTATCGLPGRLPGIPARLPERWIDTDGAVVVNGLELSDNVTPCNTFADVEFAHKTGLSYNYGSNAGIVHGLDGIAERHYIIAFNANLGYRYVSGCFSDGVCYPQRIPAMARAIDRQLARWLEPALFADDFSFAGRVE